MAPCSVLAVMTGSDAGAPGGSALVLYRIKNSACRAPPAATPAAGASMLAHPSVWGAMHQALLATRRFAAPVLTTSHPPGRSVPPPSAPAQWNPSPTVAYAVTDPLRVPLPLLAAHCPPYHPPPPASPPPPLPTVLFGRCAKAERSWPRLRAAHGPPPTPSSDPPRDQPPDGRRRTLGQPPSPPTRGGRPPLPPSPLPVREASAHRPAHAAATLPPTTRSRGGRSAAFTKKAAPLGGRWPSSGRAGGTPRKRPPPTRGAWSG